MGRRKSSYLRENIDEIPAKEYDTGSEHPTVEQLFIREASKHLTPKQRAIWEYHNYDRLSQDDIALKVGISQQAVSKTIRACEERIKKWCDYNNSVYNVIKEQMSEDETGC